MKYGERYNSYSAYLKSIYSERIQKIPVNAGFTCPTRDGSKGYGGCTYCNNVSFNPFYGQTEDTVEKQIENGIAFFSAKYGAKKFIVYFQAYTNTYDSVERLRDLYEGALRFPGVIGLVIGTRPDCVSDELLDMLAELSKRYFVTLEFGVESTHDATLNYVNRCHTFEDSIRAIEGAAKRGIEVGAHIIMNMPGESREMMLESADKLAALPIKFLKIHHLQIIKGTVMEKQYNDAPELFSLPTAEEYTDLLTDFLERLSPDMIIERFISESPRELIIAPRWNGLRASDIADMVTRKMKDKDSFQGGVYSAKSV